MPSPQPSALRHHPQPSAPTPPLRPALTPRAPIDPQDLLKLKGYLTCFPSRIVVAPKAKGYTKHMVDQVWLIFDSVEGH